MNNAKLKRKRKACDQCGRIELIPITQSQCLGCDIKQANEALKAKKEGFK